MRVRVSWETQIEEANMRSLLRGDDGADESHGERVPGLGCGAARARVGGAKISLAVARSPHSGDVNTSKADMARTEGVAM